MKTYKFQNGLTSSEIEISKSVDRFQMFVVDSKSRTWKSTNIYNDTIKDCYLLVEANKKVLNVNLNNGVAYLTHLKINKSCDEEKEVYAIFTGEKEGCFNVSRAIEEIEKECPFEFDCGFLVDAEFKNTRTKLTEKVESFSLHAGGVLAGSCIIEIKGKEYESTCVVSGHDIDIVIC
jgi:hypothetical protein